MRELNYGVNYDIDNEKIIFCRGIKIKNETKELKSNVKGIVLHSGIAKENGYHSSYGNIVVIKTDKNEKHLYGNLGNVMVGKGEKIEIGDLIATTDTHLHYEVHKDGKTINPNSYI